MDTTLGQPPPMAAQTPSAQDARTVIDEAHQRSKAFGVSSGDQPDFTGLALSHLKSVLEENRFLFQHAVPVMETLYAQIANTHSMVLLNSAQGLVLHAMGDNDFLEKANRVALVPGMDWSEKTKGTNAIGTALSAQQAVTVHGDQHFMSANHALTCSCAPILDPYGQIVGALDVTGDHRSYHQHTLALVRMSAQMIENHMFAGSFPKAVRLHFHSRPEFLGTLVEGIAAFTPEGRFLSANRSAQFQLGMSFGALQAHTFPRCSTCRCRRCSSCSAAPAWRRARCACTTAYPSGAAPRSSPPGPGPRPSSRPWPGPMRPRAPARRARHSCPRCNTWTRATPSCRPSSASCARWWTATFR